jgi:hypothetical protein
MSKGDLKLAITDLAGDPIGTRVEIRLEPVSGDPGAGGEPLEVAVNMGDSTELQVTGITCRGGPGTLYQVWASADHYRTYSFFQSIREKRMNTASDDVEFWVHAGDVKDIEGPAFGKLPKRLRDNLLQAEMVVLRPEDRDLVGARGEALYDKLGPLRKACLLNIAKKACHPGTADNCFEMIGAPMVCRQDRFFAKVDAALPERLRNSSLYKSAPGTLHEPLPGYELAEGSFKSRDAHANLQVTFMRNTSTGELAADIDIDEASGIEHGFEVIRNATFKKRTSPYLIREFLLVADLVERTLDPGYRFVF